MVTAALVNPPAPIHWSKPRAAMLMAQRGEAECGLLFFVDADALVADVYRPLQPIHGQ